jgi:uridylate kinase
MSYKRILLKLSGEALGDPETGHGIHPPAIRKLTSQITRVVQSGVEVAIVCGGGNILRGAEFSELGAERASADYMGMLGTIINGLALSDALEADGLQTRVMTALEVRSVAEPYLRRRALRHLELGRVVILSGGLGTPLFTTDTAAAQRAVELGSEVLLKATKVDGVYTADPKKDPNAKRLASLSYMEVLNDRLQVMDGTAVTMCMEHDLPVIVFDLFEDGNLERVVQADSDLGTVIRSQA